VEKQKVMIFLEILLKKFPDNLDVRIQWIDSVLVCSGCGGLLPTPTPAITGGTMVERSR
jgi:hypothetical protein